MADNSAFEIPRRPERQYTRHAGLEYEGRTVFSLRPDPGLTDEELGALLRDVLGSERYTYGDWFDLPMPVFLVHDHETGDVFRVAIRTTTIEFHVLPATESVGLLALYERLCAASEDINWEIDCRTDGD